eukprot:36353-Eustigmatos_ZCMA.PRE.1
MALRLSRMVMVSKAVEAVSVTASVQAVSVSSVWSHRSAPCSASACARRISSQAPAASRPADAI